MPTIRNAFSTSPVSAILLARNLRRMSKMFSAKGGPVYRQSFKAAPLDLAEASYTTLKGPLKYLLMPLLGKNQIAITLHM